MFLFCLERGTLSKKRLLQQYPAETEMNVIFNRILLHTFRIQRAVLERERNIVQMSSIHKIFCFAAETSEVSNGTGPYYDTNQGLSEGDYVFSTEKKKHIQRKTSDVFLPLLLRIIFWPNHQAEPILEVGTTMEFCETKKSLSAPNDVGGIMVT